MSMDESMQPTPEETGELTRYIVNFEYADSRIIELQKYAGNILMAAVLAHKQEKWAGVKLTQRHEPDRAISMFGFITHDLESYIPASVIVERATFHLFEWLSPRGIGEVDPIYAGIKGAKPGHYSKELYTNCTTDTMVFLRQLVRLRQLTPQDFQ